MENNTHDEQKSFITILIFYILILWLFHIYSTIYKRDEKQHQFLQFRGTDWQNTGTSSGLGSGSVCLNNKY